MSDYYLGEIRLFAGNFAPQDWHLCDGALVNISANEALFALIGTQFGGDGRTTDGLPDLRGRLPLGQSATYAFGATGGGEAVALTTANTPIHTHFLETAGTTATTPTAGPGVTFADTTSPTIQYLKDGLPATDQTTVSPVASTIGASGVPNIPHDNIMPCMALTYIICVNGIYPVDPQ